MSDDNAAESKIMTYTTTINSPAEAVAATHTFESDDSQPKSIPFTATDVDSDAYRVDITRTGTMTAHLPATFTTSSARIPDYTGRPPSPAATPSISSPPMITTARAHIRP